MPRVKFEGFEHTDTYARVGVGEAWKAGETRSISDSEAAYLTSTFPAAFGVVGGSVGAPPRSAAIAAASRESDDLLDGSVAEIKAGLASGEYDGELTELLEREQGGKTRRGAISAIESRMAVIA